MQRREIFVEELQLKSIHLWLDQWMLLTAGDFSSYQFNTMTVAWGSIGAIWNKPFVQVVVRPNRYTYEFLEKYDTFTLCTFPKIYKNDLQILGSTSGRHGNKISQTNLSPEASKKIPAPGFKEAELIFECRKMYFDDIDPKNFLLPSIDLNYPAKDYHRMYFGEILLILGENKYGHLE
jgi:flavin reductase (DIM6/NTAB) family NADH-FMN oxidoreductase RutF